MNWKTKIYLFTQWLFIISVMWFLFGVIILSVYEWWCIVMIPFIGMFAVGLWLEIKKDIVKGKENEVTN